MCGIAGIFALRQPEAPVVLQRMADALRHRGPDSEGYATLPCGGGMRGMPLRMFSGPESYPSIKTSLPDIHTGEPFSLGMAFRRLAIIDLSDCGHQPMLSEDGQVAMTFNGEVYNFRKLRKELTEAGYRFHSQTDSEVILAGYLLHGIEFIDQLNGMFAIAIADLRVCKLWLVRDRLGIKPLHYAESSGALLWASEVQSLLASGMLRTAPDEQALRTNFRLQANCDGCLQGIAQVPPGHWLEVDCTTAQFVTHQYWALPCVSDYLRISGPDAEAELRARLVAIAANQTVSDAPLVSLMSGGIDSTTITALCARQRQGMKAYTLGFGNGLQAFDELPQARAAARFIGVEHTETIAREDEVLALLQASFRVFSQPYSATDPELLAAGHLSALGYRVAMSGLGADEVFGGYGYYLRWQSWAQRRGLAPLGKLLPPVSAFTRKAKEVLDQPDLARFYAHQRHGWRRYQLRALWPGSPDPARSWLHIPEEWRKKSWPEQLAYLDITHNIATHHVSREDPAAMHHSLEVRYPFLDHELIEWSFSLPPGVRFGATETKPLLRAVAKEFIAPENLQMPKRGFNLPLWYWYQRVPGVRELFNEHLAAIERRGLFRKDAIASWRKHPSEANVHLLWTLVSTEGWLRAYVD